MQARLALALCVLWGGGGVGGDVKLPTLPSPKFPRIRPRLYAKQPLDVCATGYPPPA